ncbi:Cap-specific mRNA (nucleoside-2'-O-)-methyltransferase(Poly(A) polymerase regulatory subunit) (Poly(A) polymerase small subunit) (VP39) [Durusdinium trenchii]|uniref:Cap-specific mRNA (Nucleoside-2'-O-)-methyltransferase(Poly(A) polymerase regulatory subunit) (Poly(A) polymerase small subunit) (VP39) n=1 Tax=Durusdinium trenchii TaxID=1381693 RepID=A0ABP0JPX8_9DINO
MSRLFLVIGALGPVLGQNVTGIPRRLDEAFGDGGCGQNFNAADIQEFKPVSNPQKWVDAHNYYRDCHGSPPLRWDESLRGPAQAWVTKLLQHCGSGQDLEAWANAGSAKGRPHDPNLFTSERPQQGENLDCRQYDSIHDPEAASVEGWYREVNSCPKGGWQDGCGGVLNHYTTLIWKDARRLFCFVGLRGDMRVVSCRYAAEGDDSSGCQVPNTVGPPGSEGCQLGAGVPNHVPEVPGKKKHCPPKWTPPPPGAPVGAPAPAAAAPAVPGLGCVEHACMTSCIQKNQLSTCERCLNSEQCGGGMYCCPFMKKCVSSGDQKCMTPIAFCQPPCMDSQPFEQCKCNPKGSPDVFPQGWQKYTCKVGQNPVPVTTTPTPTSPPTKLIFTGIKDQNQWTRMNSWMGQQMGGWKATNMCASVEATTPSAQQQNVFTSAKGIFVLGFSAMSPLNPGNAGIATFEGLKPTVQQTNQADMDQAEGRWLISNLEGLFNPTAMEHQFCTERRNVHAASRRPLEGVCLGYGSLCHPRHLWPLPCGGCPPAPGEAFGR